MKYIAIALLTLCCSAMHAQIKGVVKNTDGKPVPFVTIYSGDSDNSVVSNDNGEFICPFGTIKKNIYINANGYKTKKLTISSKDINHPTTIYLDRIDAGGTTRMFSADSIVSIAIQNRRTNAKKQPQFEVDYYSRGTLRLENIPTKILGQQIGDLGASVDTTGNGIIYLSETVSKLRYKQPSKIHETVLASRSSGDNSGISYNNADATWYDFYRNYLPFEVNVISPISDNAFEYYKYESAGTFSSEEGKIYAIKVVSKSATSPTFNGYIYLTSGDGELYATDLTVKGSTIRQPLLNTLTIKQQYLYNRNRKLWSKSNQAILFNVSLLNVKANGTFIQTYSNYNYDFKADEFDFRPEIQRYEAESTGKKVAYWEQSRTVPLAADERNDYIKKNRLETERNNPVYSDSLDKELNRFKWTSIPIGYTYHNTNDKWKISYTGIIRRLAFNTVQAYWLGPGFQFTKFGNNNSLTNIGTDLNYGFAEQRFRATGFIERRFNNTTKRTVRLSGGSSIEQYNPDRPINKIVNSISTLFFRDNYMKLYDNNFIRVNYEEEVVNGVKLYLSSEYTRRHALRNNTDFSTLKDIYHPYTSNNPLLPWDFSTPAFEKHNMVKASISTRINFGQTYRTKPDGREIITSPDYPQLWLKYEKGFASSVKDYNFNHLSGRVLYDLTIANVGELGMAARSGIFFNSGNVAFPDWKHFNGNQTHVGKSERYLNVFNLLPYYDHSTNSRYFEGHLEHHFKGYITDNIPLFNKLQYYLVAGYHVLSTPERNPYMEFTLGLDNVGIGKFRLLRLDYVRSYEGGFKGDGVVFGLTFIDFLE